MRTAALVKQALQAFFAMRVGDFTFAVIFIFQYLCIQINVQKLTSVDPSLVKTAASAPMVLTNISATVPGLGSRGRFAIRV
jgi:hypothetical protein